VLPILKKLERHDSYPYVSLTCCTVWSSVSDWATTWVTIDSIYAVSIVEAGVTRTLIDVYIMSKSKI